jgi:DNA-binding SARP family transcriptional activator
MRIHLAGRLLVESATRQLDEATLPARQGRLAFAYLALNRRRPVPHSELAEAIWGDEPPPAWDTGLYALLSRLRRLLKPEVGIATISGTTMLELPGDAWIDIEASRSSIDEAEGFVRSGHYRDAYGPASVTVSIAQRGFLPGEEQAWVLNQRQALRMDLLRGLDSLADVNLALHQPELALKFASESAALEPYREASYERIIRAQVASGNRAEALRVYERVRRLLADELGVDPAPRLESAYLEALRA